MFARIARKLTEWLGVQQRVDAHGGRTLAIGWPVPLMVSLGGADPDRPVEAHLVRTAKCPAGCAHCYVDATPEGRPGERDTEGHMRALDALAAAGIFHVALGGGESVLSEDLMALAQHARSLGMVPNLTTSGLGVNLMPADRFRVFGRVNVSIDGVGETQAATRGAALFTVAAKAVRHLRGAGVPVGINTVVTRHNIERLGEITEFARDHGLVDVELLRLKPVGRAAGVLYDELVPTAAQYADFFPRLLDLSRSSGLAIKTDCSFVPMIAHHDPGPETLKLWGVMGCEAGALLLAVMPDGAVTGCSFLSEEAGAVEDLPQGFAQEPTLARLRSWIDDAPEPCRGCAYLSVCKGGCRAVTLGRGLPFRSPDPECPRVVAYTAR